MNKVVYNSCYGGFGISDEAVLWLEQNAREEIKEYLKLKRAEAEKKTHLWSTIEYDMGYSLVCYFHEDGIKHHDPDLVRCVEALGKKASGESADLKIYDLRGTIYRINVYDGLETIMENYDNYINVLEL